MEPFNGNIPNLINNKILKDIEFDLDAPFEEKSNNMINGIGSFYSNYIEPNLFPLIVISLLALYLTIKYILKRDREENEISNTEDSETENIKPVIRKIKRRIHKPDIEPGNNIPDESNISDMISDEYLLTDETATNIIVDDVNVNEDRLLASLGLQNPQSSDVEHNTESIEQLPMTGMLNSNMRNNEPTYNVSKATSLVFGN